MFGVWLFVLSLLGICNSFSAISPPNTSHDNPKTTTRPIATPKRIQTRGDDVLQQNNQAREYCSGCNRPPTQCLCDHLPAEKISLETKVLVLQHPVEFRRKTISTVPVLKLVLELCQVLVGRSFDVQLETIINDACDREGRIPLLLFPGTDAITLEDPDAIEQLERAHYGPEFISKRGRTRTAKDDEDGEDYIAKNKYLLIIVDGTWTQAKRMLRYSPVLLEKCHAIQFTGTSEGDRSIYDSIRKQPDSFCLSTLESCARTLKLLEPNNPKMVDATKHLHDSLKALVMTQMKYERIELEKNPSSIRNVSKMEEKKKRQSRLLVKSVTNGGSIRGIDDDDSTTEKKTSSSDDKTRINAIESIPLGDDYKLRPLKGLSDAEYVNSRWPFRSNKSLKMIEKQINADNVNATRTGNHICLGIEHKSRSSSSDEDERKLVACILRHRNGSLGILHTDEEHRRRGLGEILLKEAITATKNRNEPVFAYIVDGNKASEALFTKLGWAKADPSGKRGTG